VLLRCGVCILRLPIPQAVSFSWVLERDWDVFASLAWFRLTLFLGIRGVTLLGGWADFVFQNLSMEWELMVLTSDVKAVALVAARERIFKSCSIASVVL